jgi:hypothetical protein
VLLGLGDAPVVTTDNSDAGDGGSLDAPADQVPERTPPPDAAETSADTADTSADTADTSADTADTSADDVLDAPYEAEASAVYPVGRVGTIPGLSLWLRADKGISKTGARVDTWADQTPNGNNAQGPMVSGVDYRPTVIAGANGLPAIHFGSDLDGDGGQVNRSTYLDVADSPSLQFGSGDFLIEVVVRAVGPDTGALYVKQVGGEPFLGNGLYVNSGPTVALVSAWTSQVDDGDFLLSQVAKDTGHWRVFGMQRTGMNLSLRLDGPTPGSMELFCHSDASKNLPPAIPSLSAAGVDLYLGGRVTPGNGGIMFALADIAEVVAVGGSITTQDLNGLEGYLATKYAIH